MWPFKRRQPYVPLSTPVHEIGFKAVEAAIGPASVIKIEPFSLITHVNTIKGMLEAINLQIENVDRQTSEEATLHETNERQEANRHVIVVERLRSRNAELEQLRDTYTAALKIAAPGGSDGYGEIHRPEAVDPARMTAVGERIAVTLPPAVPVKSPTIKPRRNRKPNNPSPTPPAAHP